MKKDLKRLRETDASKEGEKILNLQATAQEVQKQQIFQLRKEQEKVQNQLKEKEAALKIKTPEVVAPIPAPKPVVPAPAAPEPKGVQPTMQKQTFAPASPKENDQRKKFMDDVEAWMNSNK